MALNVMFLALGYVLSTGALQATPPPIKDPVGELESRRLRAERRGAATAGVESLGADRA